MSPNAVLKNLILTSLGACLVNGSLAFAPAVSADAALAVPKFAPFSGQVGYEEISLSPDSWYVAFHGTRKHSPALVNAAWAARAAQLCEGLQRHSFVELRYVGEPVLTDDRVSQDTRNPPGRMVAVGGYYIPIFIPSGNGQFLTVVTPSKLAPIRCIANTETLRDKTRATSDQDAIATAKGMGLDIR